MKTTIQIQSVKSYVFILFSLLLFIPTISTGQEVPVADGEFGVSVSKAFVEAFSSPAESNQEPTWCDVRDDIAYAAYEEYMFWGEKKESDPDVLENLANYYYQIPGDVENLPAMPSYQRVNWDKLSSKAANNEVAWCAAFTSFVMRQAGINEDHGFEFSRRNLTFIVQAARNRNYHSDDYSKLFWLFDINESYAKLEVGDILCMNRKRKKSGAWSNHSFNSLINEYPQGTSLEEVKDVSHTRIVVDVYYSDGKQYATLIGGNEKSTISKLTIELEDGMVKKQPYDDKIFGVIKLMECNKEF
ncbi:MAG: hypothetical protein ACI9AT_000520 [Ulvibacter sp.]|jgi:hypothetical protein